MTPAAVLALLVLAAGCSAGDASPAPSEPAAALQQGAACPGCPPPAPCEGCWEPEPGTRWQYQLEGRAGRFEETGGIDVDICAVPYGGGACVRPEAFDIDLYVDSEVSGDIDTVNEAAVDAIHADGRRAVCYVNAGSIERYRPDYGRFVAFDRRCDGCLIGEPFSRRFPNEFWANISNGSGQRTFLLARMRDRVSRCVDAGFDAVEFDVVDAYAQPAGRTGWNVTARQQLAYNTRLANVAHAAGLSVGLKNDLGQIVKLEPYFDFAVNEQCFEFDECGRYRPFLDAGKLVVEVEYGTPLAEFCPDAARLGIDAIRKAADYSLFATPYRPCI